jgi:putative restriction endonuclease
LADRDRGREARFRLTIVPAYNYTCALTGYRCVTVDAGSIVDAAHIHQFANSRNNHPQNSIALCKNAHWLFDQGLWSLTDDYRVIVALDCFHESGDEAMLLHRIGGKQIHLPVDSSYWPDKACVTWHRERKFRNP